MSLNHSRVRAAAVCCGVAALLAGAATLGAGSTGAELVKRLRAGGLVILLRHGSTFAYQADTDPLNFENVTAQRNLDAKGMEQAKNFGAALRRMNVPIGKVYTSKYNRAYQTAVLAGFTEIEKTADVTEGGRVVSPDENARRAAALRALLRSPPPAGTNTVIVTHKPNIVDALGKDWSDVKEGEASIFQPANGSYTLLARIQMTDWPSLAGEARTTRDDK
jgi:broad specificity phosphatase PhoE